MKHSDRLAPFRPRLEAIPRAHEQIDRLFKNSPLLEVPDWAPTGGSFACKVETLNPIRSFKARGASWLVHELVEEGQRTPLFCASAGNFGQGLAWAARAAGLSCRVFAALSANPLKVERMRALGAEVKLGGEDFDAAKDLAREAAKAAGGLFVEDGRERAIAEGAATIALEILNQGEAPDAVYVPLGNGALILGMAAWLKANSPQTKVIGVCASGAPAMAHSFEAGEARPTERVATIADGIGVRLPVPEAVALMSGSVDQVVLVDDEKIRRTMRRIFDTLGLAIEPAGAAGLAAYFEDGDSLAGARVATVLCGGNLSSDLLRALVA